MASKMASSTLAEVKVGGGRGKAETDLLRGNIKDQLDRLFTQLEDLDELKSEFEPREWEEAKVETLDQLREFQRFMEKHIAGDLSLIDEFGAAQLAIQAAVSEAFKTPEVIRMFAQKQPQQLRQRLALLQRELKLKHIGSNEYNQQAVEILLALQKLEVQLSDAEKQQLESMSSTKHLETAVDKLAKGTQQTLMSTASVQIKKAGETSS